jgi:hypothetical protein
MNGTCDEFDARRQPLSHPGAKKARACQGV